MAKSHTRIYIHYIRATKNRRRIPVKNIREKVKEHIRKNWRTSIEGMPLIRKRWIGSWYNFEEWKAINGLFWDCGRSFYPRREHRG